MAVLRFQAGVVGAGGQAVAREEIRQLFRLFLQGDVDDGGPARSGADPLQQMLPPCGRGAGRDAHEKIRPMEAGMDVSGVGDAEGLADVGGDGRGGGGGQGQHALGAKAAGQAGEFHIVGAEVVAPFGDAVRLVDDHQAKPHAPQALQEAFAGEAFRGDVEELEVAAP